MGSDQPASLAAALAELQTKLPHIGAESRAQMPGGRMHKYANLAALSRELLPIMGKLGLSFSAKPTTVGDEFGLLYKLRLAGSDETDEGFYPLPRGTPPHALGSAITYGRRYILQAVTGLAADEDDDAQAAQTAADGLKRNKNGQISRKGNTAEQLAASGNMTNKQLREHEKLADEGHIPVGDLEILDRMPAEDEWSAVDARGERREPGTLPKPIGPQPPKPGSAQARIGQVGLIVKQLDRLSIVDRSQRLAVTTALAGLPKGSLKSSKDLTPEQSTAVLRVLETLKLPADLVAYMARLEMDQAADMAPA